MFDISWSELLILAVVTLIFVGPKELPRFLASIGRYVGVMRRHASEFRAVFDQAMREAEVESVKREVDNLRQDLVRTVTDTQSSLQKAASEASQAASSPSPEPRGPDPEPAPSPEPVAPSAPAPARAPEKPGEHV